MRALPALLTLSLLLAGCAAPAAERLAPAADPPPRGGAPPGHEDHDHAHPPVQTDWPDPATASIRPGVQVLSETGQCTSNFLFTSLDGAQLYIGLAAHCVEGLPLGARLDIGPGEATGTLAYSSWMTMDEVDEQDADALAYNDFALVALPDDARPVAHPAMRHFGGPTSLAASAEIRAGDKVLTYGNSGLRGGLEPASWHEGYVLETSAWSTTVYTATPGVPGDSGSGVLTGDGRALGVLVTLTLAPTAGSNGVTHLDRALAYASEHAAMHVALATWELEEGGLLPG